MRRFEEYSRGFMNRPRLFILIAVILVMVVPVSRSAAQRPASSDSTTINYPADTTSLYHAFAKGKVESRFRYFLMSTINSDSLTDYFANAAGGSVKFETAAFYRFQLALGGFFTFNIWSSDLTKPDPHSNISNRYEAGLFNVLDLSEKQLSKLEYLYLKYRLPNGSLVLGKQVLNTPFINPEDGRMRPSEVDGFYAQVKGAKITWEGGFLYHMSPRSTVKWYSVANSLGIYPKGFNPDGSVSDYYGNLSSKGIALMGLTYTLTGGWSIKAWEQFTDNIFNIWMLQSEFRTNHQRTNLFTGIRLIGENAVNYGGNPDPQKTYIPKGAGSLVVSGSVGVKLAHGETSLNYTRITKQGRFLSPREWGVEPFYTFMYRERNEGAGDVHAWMWRVRKDIGSRMNTEFAVGYYKMPDVKDVALNKYGMPSYGQLNIDAKYLFERALKGFDAEFLYVFKKRLGESYGNTKYIINKVDMSQFNLIINYKFSQ